MNRVAGGRFVNQLTKTPESDVGEWAVVSGGGGTLGAALAWALAQRGYAVLVADIHEEAAEAVAARLNSAGRTAIACHLDVNSLESWQSLLRRTDERGACVRVLVNAAGKYFCGDFKSTDWNAWHEAFDVNFQGTLFGCRTFGNALCDQDGPGHVINIVSYTAFVPLPWATAYTVSKAAVLALGEVLSTEWKPENVSVTAVCPGFFPSGLFGEMEDTDPVLREGVRRFLARSRLSADEVARAAVDGGLSGKPLVIVPAAARWLWRWKRWMPRWFQERLTYLALRTRRRLQQKVQRESDANFDGQAS